MRQLSRRMRQGRFQGCMKHVGVLRLLPKMPAAPAGCEPCEVAGLNSRVSLWVHSRSYGGVISCIVYQAYVPTQVGEGGMWCRT